MTLGELIHSKAEKLGSDYLAFIEPDEDPSRVQVLTYKGFNEKVNQLAHFLLKQGIEKGQIVSILLPNCLDFAISYFAIFKIGASALPLNTMLTVDELDFILNDSRTVALITSKCFKETAETLFERAEHLKLKWEVEKLEKKCFKKGHTSEPSVKCSADDVAIIMYTSGTTGFPKGVMLTHKSLISNVKACLKRIKITPKDNFSCLLPMFHAFTFTTCVLAPLYAGATSVVIKSLHNFNEVFRQLLKSKVSVLIAVPAVYRILTEAPVPFFLTAFPFRFVNPIRLCIAGGEALPPEVMKKFEKKFKIPLLEGYGLTETSPVVSLSSLKNKKAGSAGKALEGINIKIVSNKGRKLTAGHIGEILVKGSCIMKGYFDKEEETKDAIRNDWFYTGDLGRLDKEGFLYIVDRKKDLIVVKGLNIYPKEVEDALYTNPKIKEAAVVGKELEDYKGEVPIAYVVLQEGEKITEGEIHQYLRHSLALYKIPRRIEFRKELPKTPTGKILKRFL